MIQCDQLVRKHAEELKEPHVVVSEDAGRHNCVLRLIIAGLAVAVTILVAFVIYYRSSLAKE